MKIIDLISQVAGYKAAAWAETQPRRERRALTRRLRIDVGERRSPYAHRRGIQRGRSVVS